MAERPVQLTVILVSDNIKILAVEFVSIRLHFCCRMDGMAVRSYVKGIKLVLKKAINEKLEESFKLHRSQSEIHQFSPSSDAE